MNISKKMADELNKQVTREFHSYYIYLAMSYSFDTMGLKGFAKWFEAQAIEEQTHAIKIARYLLDQDVEVKLDTLEKPKGNFKTPVSIVQAALDHEKFITKCIHDLMAVARKENDYATATFLNWFIDEQVEEVATVNDMLTMVKMADDPKTLLLLEDRLTRTNTATAE
jgi:ferritin